MAKTRAFLPNFCVFRQISLQFCKIHVVSASLQRFGLETGKCNVFRTDANSKEWSSFILLLQFFASWITKLSQSFFGTLTCLTPKKKFTYKLPTISPVKICCSRRFGRLQQNICHLVLTCQTSIQDEFWPPVPITIASLSSIQKHFDWAVTYIHTYIHTCMWD